MCSLNIHTSLYRGLKFKIHRASIGLPSPSVFEWVFNVVVVRFVVLLHECLTTTEAKFTCPSWKTTAPHMLRKARFLLSKVVINNFCGKPSTCKHNTSISAQIFSCQHFYRWELTSGSLIWLAGIMGFVVCCWLGLPFFRKKGIRAVTLTDPNQFYAYFLSTKEADRDDAKAGITSQIFECPRADSLWQSLPLATTKAYNVKV